MNEIHIEYFALLRERAGLASEALKTRAATPAELYAELDARYDFGLDPAALRVAVNAEFADWSRRLEHGDEVVFIPPVAGG